MSKSPGTGRGTIDFLPGKTSNPLPTWIRIFYEDEELSAPVRISESGKESIEAKVIPAGR